MAKGKSIPIGKGDTAPIGKGSTNPMADMYSRIPATLAKWIELRSKVDQSAMAQMQAFAREFGPLVGWKNLAYITFFDGRREAQGYTKHQAKLEEAKEAQAQAAIVAREQAARRRIADEAKAKDARIAELEALLAAKQ